MNTHWFAAIPTVSNKHTACAGLHHLLNVFRLLGKAPGKEKLMFDSYQVILIAIFYSFTIIEYEWWESATLKSL